LQRLKRLGVIGLGEQESSTSVALDHSVFKEATRRRNISLAYEVLSSRNQSCLL
jgi:hypothetical protein